MKHRFTPTILIMLLMLCLTACTDSTEGGVDFGEYEIPSQEVTTTAYDESLLLSPDTTWQQSYALSYSYYDAKSGDSQIAEGKCGNFYQSLDYDTNIITYITQEDGYLMEYMLNATLNNGTAAVVADSDISGVTSGFAKVSVCDPYLPVYKNVTKVGTDFIANRPATRYKQSKVEDGVETMIAYIWIDDEYQFASKCELYDAATQELQLHWELLSFTRDVTEDSVKIDLSAYTLESGE